MEIRSLLGNKQILQLVLFTMCSLLALVAISGSISVKNTSMPFEIVHLITNEAPLSFSFTTYTAGSTVETQYCKINTLSRPVTLHFKIQNTTDQLTTYFTTVTVSCRLKSTSGTYDQTTSTTYTGSTVNEGSIKVSTSYGSYSCLVHVEYETKGVAGQKRLVLSIWATDG